MQIIITRKQITIKENKINFIFLLIDKTLIKYQIF